MVARSKKTLNQCINLGLKVVKIKPISRHSSNCRETCRERVQANLFSLQITSHAYNQEQADGVCLPSQQEKQFISSPQGGGKCAVPITAGVDQERINGGDNDLTMI